MASSGKASTTIPTISESTENLVAVKKKRRFLRKDRRNYALKTLCVILAVLFIAFLIAFLVVQDQYSHALHSHLLDVSCTSTECIESSSMIIQSMDSSQDPCEDFYQFACGNFDKEHPISELYMHNSWFLEKDQRLNRLVQQILEKPVNSTQVKIIKEARVFYRDCLNTSRLETIGLAPLYQLLEKLELPRAIPTSENSANFNLGKTLALAQRYLSMDIFIALSLTKGSGKTNGTILHMSPGVGGVSIFQDTNPDDDIFSMRRSPKSGDSDMNKARDTRSMSKAIKATVTFMAEVIRVIMEDLEDNYNVPNAFNISSYVTNAYKILVFSTELIRDWDPKKKNASAGSEYTTVSAIHNAMQEVADKAGVPNRINWNEYTTVLFEKMAVNFDNEADMVAVQNIEYLKHMTKVLGQTKPETIARFVWWQVVEAYARYTNSDMRSAYRKYQSAMYGDLATSPRTYTCASISRKFLSMAISHEMAKFNNISSAVLKVEEMLVDIENVFESIVQSLTWMDEATKQSTLDKARSITHTVGYPEWIMDTDRVQWYYEDLHLVSSEFLMNLVRFKEWEVEQMLEVIGMDMDSQKSNASWSTNPLQVNAYYSRQNNGIAIPAGILQAPFYFRGLESLNYGAIGTILGHELTHGFDIEGKDYNKFGEKQDDFWPEEVTEEYLDRAQCFIRQYDKHLIYPNKKLNGTFTLAENIADNGGMRESYRAYQKYVSRHGAEPKLPGLEKYTHEQLLFLSFANIWCETSTQRYKRLLEADSHSPNKVRVMATLQNMREFSEAYNCRPRSRMNPAKKCVIW